MSVTLLLPDVSNAVNTWSIDTTKPWLENTLPFLRQVRYLASILLFYKNSTHVNNVISSLRYSPTFVFTLPGRVIKEKASLSLDLPGQHPNSLRSMPCLSNPSQPREFDSIVQTLSGTYPIIYLALPACSTLLTPLDSFWQRRGLA